jgi:hypothetical protein
LVVGGWAGALLIGPLLTGPWLIPLPGFVPASRIRLPKASLVFDTPYCASAEVPQVSKQKIANVNLMCPRLQLGHYSHYNRSGCPEMHSQSAVFGAFPSSVSSIDHDGISAGHQGRIKHLNLELSRTEKDRAIARATLRDRGSQTSSLRSIEQSIGDFVNPLLKAGWRDAPVGWNPSAWSVAMRLPAMRFSAPLGNPNAGGGSVGLPGGCAARNSPYSLCGNPIVCNLIQARIFAWKQRTAYRRSRANDRYSGGRRRTGTNRFRSLLRKDG